jgi:hypothetical protein
MAPLTHADAPQNQVPTRTRKTTGIFDRRYHAFLCAYLVAPTVSEACRQAGISRSTGERWAKQPDFKAALEQARKTGVDIIVNQLVNANSAAIDSLLHLSKHGEFESTRVAAAGKLLDAFTRFMTVRDGAVVNVNQSNQVVSTYTPEDSERLRNDLIARLDNLARNHQIGTPTAAAPVIEAEFISLPAPQPEEETPLGTMAPDPWPLEAVPYTEADAPQASGPQPDETWSLSGQEGAPGRGWPLSSGEVGHVNEADLYELRNGFYFRRN